MAKPKTVQVIAPDNNAGLSRDRIIVADILKGLGYDVSLTNSLASVLQFRPGRFYANVFLEVVHAKYLRQANVNVIIPNPDWFAWPNYYRRFKAALCKSHEAVEIFSSLGFNSRYIGFISEDRYTPNVEKVPEFLHVAGKSQLKNTDKVLNLWLKNPHYPTLHLVNSFSDLSYFIDSGANIKYHYGHIPDKDLKDMQNRYLYHIQPSKVEGFSQIICESLSCGAIPITLDAAPMNELCKKEYAFLCEAKPIGNFNYGRMYDPVNLKEVVDNIISGNHDWGIMSKKSRLAYLEKKQSFSQAFRDEVTRII